MSLENQIEKSLINKAIEAQTHNPRIIVNDSSKKIKSVILNSLVHNDKFDIAVSYVVWSGLSLIYKRLKVFDSNSRMIVTTEGCVTDPKSLRSLLDLPIRVKVYSPNANDRGFHLKSYMFYKNERRSLVIGSSNISARAFGEVHEMIVEIEADKNGEIVDEYASVFDELWNDPLTVNLSEKFILKYEKEYKAKRIFEKEMYELMLERLSIRPNYMQRNALEALGRYRETNDRGLVIAATGTGKTYLSAFDVKRTKSKKMLFLVHNRTILRSAIQTFKKIFPSAIMLELESNNVDRFNNSDFVFTTDKSANNLLYNRVQADYFDYIIFDEAHKIGKGTIYEKLMGYFQPKFILGITATPERTVDPDYLFKQFNYSVPYEIRLIDALENKLVCPFSYYGIDTSTEKYINKNGYNYSILVNYIIEKISEIGHYSEKLRGIVFCKDIAEAKTVSNLFNDYGVKSDFVVSGAAKMDTDQILDKIARLESNDINDINVLCTVNKFNEGVDIPEVNTIIMLRNTESSIIFLQQLGRGLRLTSDPNKYVTVLDFIGNSNKNYTIAEALTGRKTADKEYLMQAAMTKFENVSPYINVHIEEEALKKIINNIAFEYKAKTQIQTKMKSELSRYKVIPDLAELYTNENFNELSLLQLLYGNLYEPFDSYYEIKYGIQKNDHFLKKFFDVITQFVFRGYKETQLMNYIKLLCGETIQDEFLSRILLPDEVKGGRKTSLSGEYKKHYSNIRIFKIDNGLSLCDDILTTLAGHNALKLLNEHIDLFKMIIAKQGIRDMKAFNLVTKAEFLLNTNSFNLYLNAVGEKIDKSNKTMYSPITITSGQNAYENCIVDEYRIAYYTQGDNTPDAARRKIEMLQKENYKFEVAAKFPHIKYENTSFFYMGKIKIDSISEVLSYTTEKGVTKYNHKIIFKLEERIPNYLLNYRK